MKLVSVATQVKSEFIGLIRVDWFLERFTVMVNCATSLWGLFYRIWGVFLLKFLFKSIFHVHLFVYLAV